MPQKAHLLIVDDEANTLASLSRAFRLAGHEAAVCDNAAKALELARSQSFDLIISDVVMPGKDGLSLLEELRYFVKAGLSPYEAIKAGTSDAARFLNQENEFGTVALGRRADLILLSANPLDDVGNVTKRTGVMVRGQWLSEDKLQRRLRDSLGEHSAVSGHQP